MVKESDIKTPSKEYWEKRLERLENLSDKRGKKTALELRNMFDKTFKEMDSNIQEFYNKYGVMKQSPIFTTLADGTQAISGMSSKLVVPNQVANIRLKKGTRLTNLQAQLYDSLVSLSKNQNKLMISDLSEIAFDAYYNTIYETYKGVGVGTSFNLLSQQTVSSIITNPVNGWDFSKRVWENRSKLASTVNQTLSNGIIQGVSNKDMAKRIAKNMGSGYDVAIRLVTTETNNTHNQASKIGYENSKIVKRYEYLATLDKNTSKVCGELDGQSFLVSEATTGLNFPPMHPHCRSTTTPKFEEGKEGRTRIARDLTGDTFLVPASMTYEEFKREHIDNK